MNISKNVICKYCQILLDHAKKSDADKITKVSQILPQNNLKKGTNEIEIIGLEREIPNERYKFP